MACLCICSCFYVAILHSERLRLTKTGHGHVVKCRDVKKTKFRHLKSVFFVLWNACFLAPPLLTKHKRSANFEGAMFKPLNAKCLRPHLYSSYPTGEGLLLVYQKSHESKKT